MSGPVAKQKRPEASGGQRLAGVGMMGGRAKRFCGKEQQQKDIGVWSSCFEEKNVCISNFQYGK
jgi:hypothetical protein